MSVIRYFNSHSYFMKVMKFALGLFLNENFELPAILFSGETSSGYKMKYA